MQQRSADALLAAISQSSNEVTQGWMRLMAAAPAAANAPWLPVNPALQATYLEKQTRLWAGLLAGEPQALAAPERGDRRFSHREWRKTRHYAYLMQSSLLACRYLEELVEQAPLGAPAKERARFA